MKAIQDLTLGETPGVSRRRLLGIAATGLAGAIALPLVGCSGDDSTAPVAGASTGAGAGPSTATPPSAEKPKQGGTWNRGAGGNIALASLPFQEAGTLAGGGNAAAAPPGLVWGQLVRMSETKNQWEPDHAKEWTTLSGENNSCR